MYKTKDLTPKDLNTIKIKNQAEIVQYIGSELNPEEAFELIKKESKGFTKANAKAEEADKLLFAISQGRAMPIVSSEPFEIYTMSDGFTWKILSIEEAKKRFKDNKEVYGINRTEETEHLIETEKDFDKNDEFAMEYHPEQTKESSTENKDSITLSNEQIRILKVKKETELALFGIKLRRKKEAKQKRKSA